MKLLDALHCRNQGPPPVWIMRQAGRYLPEYRQIRKRHSFIEMTHQPELAAEVTLLPIHRYDLDAAIIFSDILFISEALGYPFDFVEGVGPVLSTPLLPKDIPHLEKQAPLDFIEEAIRIAKSNLSIPLLGFSGAPFTIASYMIEGGSSRDLKKTKQWLFHDPVSFHHLLEILTETIIQNLRRQIDAGIDAVQIFESWASHLALPQLREFSFPYLKRIMDAVCKPVILFGRATAGYVSELAKLNPSGLGLDWSCDLSHMRNSVPKTIALQGNLDPLVLFAPPKTIEDETNKILKSIEGDPGFIFNLGHGILPETPPENVHILIDTIRSFSCATSSSPISNS